MKIQDRPAEHLIWAMDMWLTVRGLSSVEEAIIKQLREAAQEGTFWEHVSAMKSTFPHDLLKAIIKARQQGFLRSWPSFASP